MTKKIKWLKARCQVCDSEYEYPEGGYKPKTCNNIVCIHKWLHKPQFKTERKYGKYGKGITEANKLTKL